MTSRHFPTFFISLAIKTEVLTGAYKAMAVILHPSELTSYQSPTQSLYSLLFIKHDSTHIPQNFSISLFSPNTHMAWSFTSFRSTADNFHNVFHDHITTLPSLHLPLPTHTQTTYPTLYFSIALKISLVNSVGRDLFH